MSNARILAAVAVAGGLAIPAEGLRQVAYRDPVGVLTVCWGHTATVQPGKVYSLDECRALLDKDMTAAVTAVDRCQPGLPDSVLIAFADSVFNLGPKVACDTRPPPHGSTAARMLKAGDYVGACNQLPRWSYARVAGQMVQLPGLVKRREHARQVCLSGLQ
jgi:lysozyme